VRATIPNPEEILNKIDWETWVKKPGLPPITLDFTTPVYFEAVNMAQDFLDLSTIFK